MPEDVRRTQLAEFVMRTVQLAAVKPESYRNLSLATHEKVLAAVAEATASVHASVEQANLAVLANRPTDATPEPSTVRLLRAAGGIYEYLSEARNSLHGLLCSMTQHDPQSSHLRVQEGHTLLNAACGLRDHAEPLAQPLNPGERDYLLLHVLPPATRSLITFIRPMRVVLIHQARTYLNRRNTRMPGASKRVSSTGENLDAATKELIMFSRALGEMTALARLAA